MPIQLDMALLAIPAVLLASAPWFAGLVIGGLVYRRRRTAALKLTLIAFFGLTAWGVMSGIVFTLAPPVLLDVEMAFESFTRILDGMSLFFQVGRTALVILLAVALFRLLKENHAGAEHL